MTVQTLKSEQVRRNWRDMLDEVFKGGSVIIQRYSKPLAVLINYDEYQRMKDIEAERINESSQTVKAGNYTSGKELDHIFGEKNVGT